jgi:hypothetical protein
MWRHKCGLKVHKRSSPDNAQGLQRQYQNIIVGYSTILLDEKNSVGMDAIPTPHLILEVTGL